MALSNRMTRSSNIDVSFTYVMSKAIVAPSAARGSEARGTLAHGTVTLATSSKRFYRRLTTHAQDEAPL